MAVKITPQDTELHFFGAGADTYSWWRGMSGNWNFCEETPDNWCMTVKISEPVKPGVREVMLTHSMLMGAVRRIAEGPVRAGEACVKNCKLFLQNPEDADFDAGDADQVLQLAALGEIPYG